jgi:hypothetical protein
MREIFEGRSIVIIGNSNMRRNIRTMLFAAYLYENHVQDQIEGAKGEKESVSSLLDDKGVVRTNVFSTWNSRRFYANFIDEKGYSTGVQYKWKEKTGHVAHYYKVCMYVCMYVCMPSMPACIYHLTLKTCYPCPFFFSITYILFCCTSNHLSVLLNPFFDSPPFPLSASD